MNKGLTALLVLVIVGLAGVFGGYIWAEQAIESGIEDAFRNAAQTDGVNAASYQSIDVNLIGDTVTLSDVESTMDARALLAAYANLPPELTVEGTIKQSHGTIVVTGVRDLFFGGTTIAKLRADDGRVTITGSTRAPRISSAAGLNGQTVGTTGANIDFTADIARLSASGVDISAYLAKGVPAAEDFIHFTADELAMTSLVAQGTVHPTLNGTERKDGEVRLKYKVASAHGTDITPQTYGPIALNDIAIDVLPVGRADEALSVTASTIAVTDVRFVDAVPIKLAYEINDLVFTPGKVADPKFLTTLALVGIDEINLDFKMAYDIDPETGRGAFGPFVANLKQAGQIDLAMDLGGLPDMAVLKQMQTDPESLGQAEIDAAMGKVSVKHAELGYSDNGILKKFVAAQAMDMTGGDVTRVADALARQGASMVALSHGPEKAQDVYGVLNAYLTAPGEIRVQLDADTPVNLQQLIQAFAIAGPRALGVFDLQVTTPQ